MFVCVCACTALREVRKMSEDEAQPSVRESWMCVCMCVCVRAASTALREVRKMSEDEARPPVCESWMCVCICVCVCACSFHSSAGSEENVGR